MAELLGYENWQKCTAHGLRRGGITRLVNTPGLGASTIIGLSRHKNYSTVAHYEKATQGAQDRCLETLNNAGGRAEALKLLQDEANKENSSVVDLDDGDKKMPAKKLSTASTVDRSSISKVSGLPFPSIRKQDRSEPSPLPSPSGLSSGGSIISDCSNFSDFVRKTKERSILKKKWNQHQNKKRVSHSRSPARILGSRSPARSILGSRSNHEERITRYDDRSTRFQDHPTRLEDRPTRYEDHPTRYDDRSTRYDDRPTRYDDRPTRYDDCTPRYDDRQPRFAPQPTRYEAQPPQYFDYSTPQYQPTNYPTRSQDPRLVSMPPPPPRFPMDPYHSSMHSAPQGEFMAQATHYHQQAPGSTSYHSNYQYSGAYSNLVSEDRNSRSESRRPMSPRRLAYNG